MNPLLGAALGSILRWGLAILAGYLVNVGIWKPDEAESYVGAAALGILALGWSLFQKYRARIKFLAALDSPKGTEESELDTRGISVTRPISVVLLAILASGMLACGGNPPPNTSTVGPAGRIAWQATRVTDAAKSALGAVEVATDQGLISRPVAVQIIGAIRQVGLAGTALADALRVYVQTKGAGGGYEIRTTADNIQRLVTDALVMVPDLPTRQRVQGILQPILNALTALLVPFDAVLVPEPAT